MEPQSLTPYERQQLINQYKILELLDPSQSEYYRECQRILIEGYSILYGDVFETWKEMSEDECRYVFDVLDLFRTLRFSYDELRDKQGLTEDYIRFGGFDGNNEGKNLSFLTFLKDQGKWQETLEGNRDFNSHSIVTVGRYPEMLKRWKEVQRQQELGFASLSAGQIRFIVSGEMEPA
jgi:hypothetical protein